MDEKISNAAFWLALLDMGQGIDQRARLWNGYLGWKLPQDVKGKCEPHNRWTQLIVTPPYGGWPVLTEEEKKTIDSLAAQHGGHPEFGPQYMNFSAHTFCHEVDFSGFILVHANFDQAKFEGEVNFSKGTIFYGESIFSEALFKSDFFCLEARFEGEVYFSESCFKRDTLFCGVEFMGGAFFANVVFERGAKFDYSRFEQGVQFDHSRFEQGGVIRGIEPQSIVSFKNVRFIGWTTFLEVLFASGDTADSRVFVDSRAVSWSERKVDFSDAVFETTTSFRGAIFEGVPAFFNTTLHEDTDFSDGNYRVNLTGP